RNYCSGPGRRRGSSSWAGEGTGLGHPRLRPVKRFLSLSQTGRAESPDTLEKQYWVTRFLVAGREFFSPDHSFLLRSSLFEETIAGGKAPPAIVLKAAHHP
ncbi:unnamed protein product, partial [Scytosiphon promiscuus]